KKHFSICRSQGRCQVNTCRSLANAAFLIGYS
ncbi:MAG: hypothetical protein ACI9FB_003748, partial [Candidatus Azotimanducaceae bacterium]